jgi:phosphoribosylformylglycinamidine cyclo-ligase
MPRTYADAGVDVSKVRRIQDGINRAIFKGKKGALVGHYAGIVDIGGVKIAMHTDGVGSKVVVAQDVGKYDTVGIDAIAMNVNDIICVGARPVAGVDYLAVAEEDEELISQVISGLVRGADMSKIDIVGGETAILPGIIAGGKRPFDLSFTVIGVFEGEMTTGEKTAPGDAIIGIASSGLHSNGFSLARKLLPVKDWGERMLTPTEIYSVKVPEVAKMCNASGLAHITGGAFSKITRLGKNLGFVFDSLPEEPDIFRELGKKVGDVREMHRTFNMGVGMCMVCPKENAELALRELKKRGLESWVVGKITNEAGVKIVKGGASTRID